MAARAPGSGRLLAAIPLGVGLVLGALMLPRAVPPLDVPRPMVDARALAHTVAEDDARARNVETNPLPPVVRAVGSGLRAFLRLQADSDADVTALDAGRRALDAAVSAALAEAPDEELLRLRAVQLHAFLAAVDLFEARGEESTDLVELGGGFVRRFQRAGWVVGRRVILDRSERRVAFKLAWNSTLLLDGRPRFALTLDEERVLYGLYLAHPHPPDAVLAQIEMARKSARDAAACAALDAGERLAAETWRADKIRKLATADPSYPAAYALGIAHFRRGAYPAAAQAFRDWIDAHPDGPYALRARNFLRAAIAADTSVP